MSKKNKEVSKLRREVEFLKSQLKNREAGQDFFKIESNVLKPTKTTTELTAVSMNKKNNPEVILENSNPYLKKDLLKSVSLSVFSFTVIFLIATFSDKTSLIYKWASPFLSKFVR